METKSRVTHANGKTLLTYTVLAHKPREKMGKKSTSAVENTIPEETIDIKQRSYAITRHRLKRLVNEWAGHLCAFTHKQAPNI